MAFNFSGDFIPQAIKMWQGLKPYQKASIGIVAFFLMALFTFLVINSSVTHYAALFPADRVLTSTDTSEIKLHLDRLNIPYWEEMDSILVPADKVRRIRMDLAASGYPKLPSESKGYELFDTSTWIRGEKELQILELRALKGQLEKDISQFENIRSASVILDIAPPRPFGGSLYKTKASVILNLIPGARLTPTELRAITFHVSGAVRGLTPNMVAISDTTGKLYQPIDPDGNADLIRGSELSLEDHLKAKIDGMLSNIVGVDNYYSSVQVVMSRDKTMEERKNYASNFGSNSAMRSGADAQQNAKGELEKAKPDVMGPLGPILGQFQENRVQTSPLDTLKTSSGPGKIDNISIAVLIDRASVLKKFSKENEANSTPQTSLENFGKEIENQLNTILKGYNVDTTAAVDFVDFDPSRFTLHPSVEAFKYRQYAYDWRLIAALAGGLILLVSALWGFVAYLFNRRHRLLAERESQQYPKMEKMLDAIKSHVNKDPDAMASHFRDWIKDNAHQQTQNR